MSDIARTDLTDFTIHRTDAARKRLARRYAAEARFKALGLAAVLSAMIALLLLLSTIVTQAIPAFTMNYATLPVTLSGEHIDQADLGKSDFDAVANEAIDAALPFAEGRTERRAARGLLSDAAGIILREEVLADPALVGAVPRQIALPVSDTADLFLKGLIVDPETITAAGTATPSAGSGEITIKLEREATSRIRADLSDSLKAQAARLSRDASRAASSSEAKTRQVEGLKSRVAEADEEGRPALEAELSKAQAELNALQSDATSLKERSTALLAEADTTDSESKLGGDSPSYLLHIHSGIVKVTGVQSDGVSGEALVPLQTVADAGPGEWRLERLQVPESSRQISDREVAYLEVLQRAGFVSTHFNTIFFTRGASREPEMAGVLGAVVGSFLTLIVTIGIAFPIGVASAVYLEEFAPKNRWTMLIEVNINNLAAVPSIVFGLLGLAVFLNFFGLPRSAPIVGGMVLALMTLPIIIIASRAALKAVPPSIREAALGVGASKLQTVFHHVLPLAMPGIMTGTILGMAHALGETAPLLMIGMVAFIVDVPHGIFDAATLLPVQIFMWADFPEQAFQQKTSAAILVLLSFLVVMNAIAVVLRRRFERRW
jgi:phosphate transport system permease protein